jgi:hypothetical protein
MTRQSEGLLEHTTHDEARCAHQNGAHTTCSCNGDATTSRPNGVPLHHRERSINDQEQELSSYLCSENNSAARPPPSTLVKSCCKSVSPSLRALQSFYEAYVTHGKCSFQDLSTVSVRLLARCVANCCSATVVKYFLNIVLDRESYSQEDKLHTLEGVSEALFRNVDQDVLAVVLDMLHTRTHDMTPQDIVSLSNHVGQTRKQAFEDASCAYADIKDEDASCAYADIKDEDASCAYADIKDEDASCAYADICRHISELSCSDPEPEHNRPRM